MACLPGCFAGDASPAGVEPEPEPRIKSARFFDYQTRYLAEPTGGGKGFELTVFVNARGRSFGHAGIRLLQTTTQRVADKHAQEAGRAIDPIDSSDISMSVETYEASGELVWFASTTVRWAKSSK